MVVFETLLFLVEELWKRRPGTGYACRLGLCVTRVLLNQDTLESERVLERERAALKAYFEKAGAPTVPRGCGSSCL